jgi:hypothetical protein
LKKKRQEIAKSRQKIQELSEGKVINARFNENAGGAAYRKVESRFRLNDNGKKELELDYSGRKGALRFIKPPVATTVWQTVVSNKKTAKNRPTNCCFKCFLPGHYKKQCRNNIKCLKCGRSGHIQYKSKETHHNTNKDSNNLGRQNKDTQHNTSQVVNNLFYAERPDITTVYFERRDHLNQHTQFLHRSGLVTFRQGAPLPERRHQVVAALARRIGWNHQDYEVYESGVAHYIIIFSGPLNRNQAVRYNP